MNRLTLLLVLLLVPGGTGLAQSWGWGAGGDRYYPEYETCLTAREVPSHSTDTPTWTNQVGFDSDTFAFARVRYTRTDYASWGAGYWWTDFPDSDLNLSLRLQQVTSVKVDPNGRVLNLTDKELAGHPWVYMCEPGRLRLKNDEVLVLRRYLQNGGFLMADDFWGDPQWENFEREFQRVLPGREFVELPMTHPIFHCVFNLGDTKNKLQTPNIVTGRRSGETGVSWETHDGEPCVDLHIRAILDDKQRIMVLATHNCDNGDGWEREGEDDHFFHEFCEKRAYPLGINIIFYTMTH